METLVNFTTRWLGTALPKLFLLFLGILLCILVVAAIWDRRIKILGASFGISLGILLLAIALGESFAGLLGGLDVALRMRLVAVLISIMMLLLTIFTFLKTGLHLRYGILWVSLSLFVLLTALFPAPLGIFPSLLGIRYGLAVVVLALLFLVLLTFHLSSVISDLQDRQLYLQDRICLLEQKVFGGEKNDCFNSTPRKHSLSSIFLGKLVGHKTWRFPSFNISHGTAITAPIIIVLIVLAVIGTGMLAPQAMIGDEVTHYYMMQTQSKNLLAPNFIAEIPTGWGKTEIRRYPHSFLWHYFAAVLFYLSGGSFFAIQMYQAFFLAQLLGVAYLLARSRRGVETRSALVYLLLIASLPMTLIFSVAFYQDVPMTAQIVTAFYLLRKNRWVIASCFLCLALGLKVTAILFFPAFFFFLLVWTFHRCSKVKTVLILCCSVVLVCSFTLAFSRVMRVYGHATFYPVVKAEQVMGQVSHYFSRHQDDTVSQGMVKRSGMLQQASEPVVSEQMAEVIANHPGDLRIKSNFIIYGGLLLYLCLTGAVLSVFGLLFRRDYVGFRSESSWWLWGTGLSYILLVALFLRTAPDARFFLPGLVFCMLPIAERVVCLPKPRWIVMIATALALMQTGYALAKTYHLRCVGPEMQAAIHFLQEHPPSPRTLFMYPEGNYRLFPVPHEWYLNYYLRDFWHADNDERLVMLHKHAIGAIVIKKNLIAPVDPDITNLGVYPDYFVNDIRKDDRFRAVFENNKIVVFQVPEEK